MNILFLDQFSELGGAQQCLLDLLPAVARRGWKAVLAAPGAGPLAARAREIGVSYTQIRCGPFRSWRKSAADVLRFTVQAPLLAYRIAELAREMDAELIYVNGPRLMPSASRAAAGRIPLVFHCHSRLPPGYTTRLVGRALRRSRAALIGNCRYVLRPLDAYAQGEVVYNGVAPLPPVEPASHTRPFTIGVIGRVAPEKGQADFVEAAKLVLRTHPGCRFVVCGAPLFGDSASRRYDELVRAAAAELPIDFPGWRNDVAEVMAGLDLLVAPSTAREATTRVVLEAFAAGVPVLASAAGGIPEIVTDGETGYLTPPSCPMALAARMCQVIDAGAERRRAVANAAQRAWRERFTLERYQRDILMILERVGSSARV